MIIFVYSPAFKDLIVLESCDGSPNAAGQHTAAPTAHNILYGRFIRGSPRHMTSLDTDMGQVHLSYSARKRSGGVE
ncbi:hypothetical protein EVAR_80980_1 [Eumeta japonica]|uniref:Uncharacterized protein n=1 Tax=Eumeta variegata TaxID=151549 RepID=A0A4C1WNQ9_EUMVA|nr:hypothetical protein EVAR_80980_1 [Eumeta japonica]